MPKKSKYQITEEQKRRAVDDYVSGRKRAEDVARDLGVPQGYLYKWRVQFDERAKGERIEELEDQGLSRDQALLIERQRDEIEAYKQTVAKQAVIIDLLKKLQTSNHSPLENELTGLIDITKRSVPKEKPQK
ncbi:MAG: transposase [Bdellovibrionota bacterium]